MSLAFRSTLLSARRRAPGEGALLLCPRFGQPGKGTPPPRPVATGTPARVRGPATVPPGHRSRSRPLLVEDRGRFCDYTPWPPPGHGHQRKPEPSRSPGAEQAGEEGGRMTRQPSDVVDGPDPNVTVTSHPVDVVEWRCSCGYHLWTGVDAPNPMDQHLFLIHPARRNPDLTCQAAPPWDHERWCLRAKGHEGVHWTPSGGDGMEWPQ
jgi:hypothetical protein